MKRLINSNVYRPILGAKFTVYLVFVLFSTLVYSQTDTSKVNRLIEQCYELRYSNSDSCRLLAKTILEDSKTINYHYGVAKGYYFIGDSYLEQARFGDALDYLDSAVTYTELNNEYEVYVDAVNLKGIMYSDLGEYDKSIKFYEKGIEKAQAIDYKRGENIARSNIGVTYYFRGNFDKSLEYFVLTLDHFQEVGDTANYLICLGNVVSIYIEIELYDEGLEYLEDGISMSKASPEFDLFYSELLSSKAVIFSKKKKYKQAIDLYKECIAVKHKIPDWRGIARMYNNMAEVYFSNKEIDKAIPFAEKAMHLVDSLNYKRDLAFFNKTMALCFVGVNDNARAKKYILNSIKMSEEIGAFDDLKDAYELSSSIFAELGDYQRAYEHQIKMSEIKDSLNKVNSEKTMEEMVILHQLDKRELENEKLKEENEKERLSNLLKDEQLAKDEAQKKYLFVGLSLMLLIAAFIFRAYRNKKKTNILISSQKEKVEAQKHLIEEAHQEITDSIEYAKKIQDAILPPTIFWNKNLKDSFVLFLPKDIVAGDFYWMEKKDGRTFFAAADCTGHGVPGAMVSVVCHNALNRAVREFRLEDPGEILDKVTDLVLETFEKSDREVKDGMDITLCVLDGMTLKIAGAHNPLWLIRSELIDDLEPNLELDERYLYEFKVDKQPVGQYEHRKPFQTQLIHLKPNDAIYMSSDGFPDQFGGDRGKKMKSKNFKKLILQSSHHPIKEQHELLQNAFDEWRGTYEQLDDVCVIGVKI